MMSVNKNSKKRFGICLFFFRECLHVIGLPINGQPAIGLGLGIYTLLRRWVYMINLLTQRNV